MRNGANGDFEASLFLLPRASGWAVRKTEFGIDEQRSPRHLLVRRGWGGADSHTSYSIAKEGVAARRWG